MNKHIVAVYPELMKRSLRVTYMEGLELVCKTIYYNSLLEFVGAVAITNTHAHHVCTSLKQYLAIVKEEKQQLDYAKDLATFLSEWSVN